MEDMLEFRRVLYSLARSEFLVDDNQIVRVGLADDLRRVCGYQNVWPQVLEYTEELSLQISVQVNVRLIDHEQGRMPASHDVSEQLTPDLETKSRPE